jgi:hypothetical protein
VLLVLGVTAGGRVPLSGRGVAYLILQIGTKWVDMVVIAECFFAEKMTVDGEGKAEPDFESMTRVPPHRVVAGLAYCGLRVADGWFMASMPINTPPWRSLLPRLLSLMA